MARNRVHVVRGQHHRVIGGGAETRIFRHKVQRMYVVYENYTVEVITKLFQPMNVQLVESSQTNRILR